MGRGQARKKSERRSQKSSSQAAKPESRASVAVTVGWMLCTLVTFVFQLASITAGIAARSVEKGDETLPFRMLPGFLLLVSVLAGLATLALTFAVYRVRDDAPPNGVTIVAVVVALIPLIVSVLTS